MNKDNAKDYLPLVQALAEGKVIQGHMAYSGRWEDISDDIRFDGPASDYRIKPEPQEIWVNWYAKDVRYVWDNQSDALENAAEGAITRRYREVIE